MRGHINNRVAAAAMASVYFNAFRREPRSDYDLGEMQGAEELAILLGVDELFYSILKKKKEKLPNSIANLIEELKAVTDYFGDYELDAHIAVALWKPLKDSGWRIQIHEKDKTRVQYVRDGYSTLSSTPSSYSHSVFRQQTIERLEKLL